MNHVSNWAGRIRRGVRVAWSCVGSLVSLARVGWAGASLAATPASPAPPGVACAQEEATTELNGSFRWLFCLVKIIAGDFINFSSYVVVTVVFEFSKL